jgi:DNA-binding transcriptional regulator GbsR (MarR family)
MEYLAAKDKFIQTWGTLGSSWGINRTMAQVHAFLMISAESQTTEQIMEGLQISGGNANMNLRELLNWGLIYKEHRIGERREFFYAEKDIWKVAKQIIKERRKREIEPVLKVLEELKNVDNPDDKDVKAFTDTIANIERVVEKADFAIDKAIKLDENAFVSMLFKLLK